jgi:DNA-binding transcriptional MerR regulator
MAKADDALRTIGEVSEALDIPQHILRYWETRFPSLRPLQRAGNRRYYRPADVALVARIKHLLDKEGYTIRGVQKLLGQRSGSGSGSGPDNGSGAEPAPIRAELTEIRTILSDALEADSR